jgi:hypothetical protein
VTPQELQHRFNTGNYWQRVQAGQLQSRIVKSKPCHLPTEPPGTLSQIVAYDDGSQRIALVHQYLRPDGTLGASGKPDPKELIEGGVGYFV